MNRRKSVYTLTLNRYSSYRRLVYVTSWVMRFIGNLKKARAHCPPLKSPLTVKEVAVAETYWISVSQAQCFNSELKSIHSDGGLSSSSFLLPLHPFVDSQGLLRVGGRKRESNLAYAAVILSGKHQLTKPIIQNKHLRLLHAGPTLLTSSLNYKYHIIGGQKSVRSITQSCLRRSQKPRPQLMGQLPIERVTPDIVFENVGVDYTDQFTSNVVMYANL